MKVSELLKGFDERLAKHKEEIIRKGSFYGHLQGGVVTALDIIHKSASKVDQIVEFQKRADDCVLLASILKVHVTETSLYKSFSSWMKSQGESELKKAMTTTGSHTGSDWVPNGYSAELMRMIEAERKLANFFPSFNMTQNPFIWPITTAEPTAYLATEGAAVTESADATASLTFSAKKLMCYISVTDELEEDSIISILPTIKESMARSLATGEENAILNGCADNTIDSDNTTAGDQRRAVNGLRSLAIANSYQTDLGTFNSDTLGAMRAKLGKFYAPDKCIFIASPSGFEQLSRLKNASGDYVMMTMDKLGNDAVIKTGQVGQVMGSPVVLSGLSRDILNASGKYDATTMTKCAITLVRTDAYKIGRRGGIKTGTQRQEKTQTTDLVASTRIAFMPMFPIASNATVWNGYNITA